MKFERPPAQKTVNRIGLILQNSKSAPKITHGPNFIQFGENSVISQSICHEMSPISAETPRFVNKSFTELHQIAAWAAYITAESSVTTVLTPLR